MTARTHRGARHAASFASVVLVAALVGCSPAASRDTSTSATSSTASVVAVASAKEARENNVEVHDAGDAASWDASTETVVTLSGTTATVAGAAPDAVTVDGSTVTVTRAGTYRLTGTLTDGQVVVATADEDLVRVVLDGAQIASSTSSPLFVEDAGVVAVVLAAGTRNTLSDAAQYEYAEGEDEPNAALFSTADLTIAGTGQLTVEGRSNDGIASKDGLVIESGSISVSALDDGVRGKDYLLVEGGTLLVEAGGDGLKSDQDEDAGKGWIQVLDGTVDVTAGDDGIAAQTDVIVDGGAVTVAATGDGVRGAVAVVVAGGAVNVTQSEEGIEGALIAISGGTTSVVASDDGLNASDGSGSTAQEGPGGTGGVEVPAGKPTDMPERGEAPAGGGAPGGAEAPSGERPSGDMPAGGQGGQGGGRGGMGGATTYTRSDDLHIEISGGALTIDAGGDGIDSNGSLSLSGGATIVYGPMNAGNGALDAESGIQVTGGTLVALGAAGMAQAPDAASAQPWVQLTGAGEADVPVEVVDDAGTVVATFTSPKAFGDAVVSAPDLVAGASYSVKQGGSTVATATATAAS
ncbi:uncharacterized protein DUF4353 [Flavimobilis soli]|uniref:Uncharacterized protein DUF4353 n=1 Tax=Flavimobilis soli TaxID=442709 RepID=A0A2A9EBK6_9MICO|nr:carbohydrate-binding domain-containing protein [Flavimobilis soli]PFG36437.1 uncharacterized protein DUF4353 [Flavimobilis soli]